MTRSSLLKMTTKTRDAQRQLAHAGSAQRTLALKALSETLTTHEDAILQANQADCDAARHQGISSPLQSRLALSPGKLQSLKEGLGNLAALPDPVGCPKRKMRLDDGLILTQVASPIGVLLIIFESRPDAVIQIGSLAIRSGNAVILKGGREAKRTNAILVDCLREALASVGLPSDAVQCVEDRGSVAQLLDLDQHIDLVIPRGSGELVRRIQEQTRIPVLGHAEGVCTLFIDEDADTEMAARLAVDGKCDYPAACNATETLLIHRAFLPRLPVVGRALQAAGVTLRACPETLPCLEGATPAGEADGRTEYGDLILAVQCVGSMEEAIGLVHTWGSGHTDAIVTHNTERAETFLASVDSASVFHNCSTRFADGFRYGLGAEVGISTGRIHARGPVGVEGLMTTRWLLRGTGQEAGHYGPGKAAFLHELLEINPADASDH
jgi:glutamate-5-semialdehyde dehydrogenase